MATAEAGDAEMAERIAAPSRAARSAMARPSRRRAISPPRLQIVPGHTPVLVDCLTLWLSNLMLADADIDAETAHLEQALAAATAPVVLVANEVGSGIVPDIRSAGGFAICRACSTSASPRAPIASCSSSPDCRSR